MSVLSRLLALAALLSVAFAADARLYVWSNPDSGSVEMSGKPPTWYRGQQRGPRVQVYDGGTLVDDTAIALHPKHDEELREAAFAEFELRKKEDALKRLERAARRERLKRTESERLAAAERGRQAAQEAPSGGDAPDEIAPESLDRDMVDRLKSIIQAWDSQNQGGS